MGPRRSPSVIELGASDLATLRAALAAAGVRHNAYAEALLPAVPVAPAPVALSVVIGPLAAFGAPEGATLDDLLARVAPDLCACPLEAALRLALDPPELEPGVRLTVVSPRPTPDEAAPRGFYLRRDADGLWLRAYVASDDWVFGPDEPVVLAVGPRGGRCG